VEEENAVGDESNVESQIPELEAEMDSKYDMRIRSGLQPSKERDYSKHLQLKTDKVVQKPNDFISAQIGHEGLYQTALTQYSINREFGQAGTNTVLKEMQQLHDQKVGDPLKAHMMTKQEKRAALEYLMFLTNKHSGKIKGHGCADGRKQRVYKTKEETSSPMVSVESLFLSCIIDAEEGRDVAACDIPGAFLHADVDCWLVNLLRWLGSVCSIDWVLYPNQEYSRAHPTPRPLA
jgi:hypothetical protein